MREPLILIVTPRGPRGVFVGAIGERLTLRPSRHPFVDAARALLGVGVDPGQVLIQRTKGSALDQLSGPIGRAARLTLKEGRKPRAARVRAAML